MLPDEALVALSHAVNSLVLTTSAPKELARHKSVSSADVWRWIGQRLDITLNVKMELKAAYNSVPYDR
jgi:hypothetical protein